MLKLTSCERVRFFFFFFPFLFSLPPPASFLCSHLREATDRHSVFSPKARTRRCNSCWLGPPARGEAGCYPVPIACAQLHGAGSLSAPEGGERAQLPPTSPRVRDATGRLGWPGGSSSLRGPCVGLESIRLRLAFRTSFCAVPLPQACSETTSASDLADSSSGPGFAAVDVTASWLARFAR